jgi:hypothetical protein
MRSYFADHLFIAAGGMIAQAIPFLAMSALTPLYDPSMFALYTIIASLVGCIRRRRADEIRCCGPHFKNPGRGNIPVADFDHRDGFNPRAVAFGWTEFSKLVGGHRYKSNGRYPSGVGRLV